jgi:hypothetical protein
MFPDEFTAFLIRKEQTKDWLREVEKDRLVRLALSGQPDQAHFYCRLLSFVGEQMVVWGRRLQERYDVPIKAPPALESGPQPGGC